MPTAICQESECGEKGKCYCREVGGRDDYKDEYTFVCEKNNHITKKTISGGSVTGENWFTECPFCKKSSTEHSPTPKSFL